MAADILSFPARPTVEGLDAHPEPVIPDNPERSRLQCSCGSVSFMLLEDGEAECLSCSGVASADGRTWVAAAAVMRLVHEDVRKEPPVDPVVIRSGDLALARWWKTRVDRGVAFAMAALEDGTVSSWVHDSTPETEAWILRKLDVAKDMHAARVGANQEQDE